MLFVCVERGSIGANLFKGAWNLFKAGPNLFKGAHNLFNEGPNLFKATPNLFNSPRRRKPHYFCRT
ncbi:hypothetical protein EBO34_13740 [Alteribacter keqinensis]|uniref:Uncharacterized protein n=1 Tax=Alteribacter keqinensis TaxID=2483800 RepID=A0A3M7TQC8_9BACI|nr:hypothetical protein EBO34_13740 [Alteribacter keqinensis]